MQNKLIIFSILLLFKLSQVYGQTKSGSFKEKKLYKFQLKVKGNLEQIDTLRLYWSEDKYGLVSNGKELKSSRKKDGIYSFEVSGLNLRDGYFNLAIYDKSLYSKTGRLLMKQITPSLYFKVGQSISLDIKRWYSYNEYFNYFTASVDGKGKDFLRLKCIVDSIYNYQFDLKKGPISIIDSINKIKDITREPLRIALDYLEKNKFSVKLGEYNQIKASVFFYSQWIKYRLLAEKFDEQNPLRMKAIGDYVKSNSNNIDFGFADQILINCPNFFDFLLVKNEMECKVLDRSSSQESQIKRIMSVHGDIGKLLLIRFMELHRRFDNQSGILNQVQEKLSGSPWFKDYEKFKIQTSIGKQLDFSLENADGKIVKLSDFRGKVVLIDFWFTGCGGCTIFYQNVLSKIEKSLENDTNFVFISVNTDNNKKVWLNSLLGNDALNKPGAKYANETGVNLFIGNRRYEHPLIKDLGIIFYPTVILIDRNGRVRKSNDIELYHEETLFQILNEQAKHENK